jgi:hypothetical protein
MSKRALVMINSTSILEPTVIPLIEDGIFVDLISPNPQGNPGPPLFTPPTTYFAALPEGGREGQEITLRRVRNPGGMNLSPISRTSMLL